MPILEIEIVLRPGESLAADLASTLADRSAAALNSRTGGTWVRLRKLGAEEYAEDGGGPPSGIYPVFVTVLKADLPPPDELAAEVGELAQAIAEACDRPAENVHILYQPPARGRIAFGGRLLS